MYDLKRIEVLQLARFKYTVDTTCLHIHRQGNNLFFENRHDARCHFYIRSVIFSMFIQGEEDKFEPLNQSLTFGDLRKSIAAVGREAAQSKFTRHQLRNTSEGVTLGNCPICQVFIFF